MLHHLSLTWAQLLGMVRYEFKMHWRRRTLAVLLLAFMSITIVSLLIFLGSVQQFGSRAEAAFTPYVSAYAVLAAWMPLSVGLALVLPVMVADTIPLDRQYGVRALLDSLPLPRAVYLAGKLFGLWAALLISLFGTLAITALVWRVSVGAFDARPYLEMGVVGAGALALMNGGLGLLAAVGQPSRRRAIVLLIALLAVFLLALPTFMDNWDLRQTYNSQILNPIRMPIINRYFFGIQIEAGLSVENPVLNPAPELVRDTVLAGFAQVALVWLLAWAWLRWRDGRG